MPALNSQGSVKIGHVNMDELMTALPETDSAKVKLQKEQKEFQDTYELLNVEYNNLFDQYQKNQGTYNDLMRKTKESELMDKQRRIAEFEQNASQTLQARNAELLKPIYDKVLKAIDKVATENSYTYILDLSKGAVVFTSKDSQNINPLVMNILRPK